MLIDFYKYQGAGNDFIIVPFHYQLGTEQIRFLCDRHFGVGSDGLMRVGYSPDEPKTLQVVFHNPDASLSFCGNGSRCAMAYAVTVLGEDPTKLRFNAFDGQHHARYANDYAHVEMFCKEGVHTVGDMLYINTGAPHVVYKVNNVDAVDLKKEAQHARYHKQFQPTGTNVNFYDLAENGHLRIRTFEKGVEDETLACGTGITAVALVHHRLNQGDFNQSVIAQGGICEVERKNNQIYLGGPAKLVFTGSLNLPNECCI